MDLKSVSTQSKYKESGDVTSFETCAAAFEVNGTGTDFSTFFFRCKNAETLSAVT